MNAFRLYRLSLAVVALALGLGGVAQAQVVINDTLTGPSSSYDWKSLNGACLTAGDGSASTIPACVGLAYYTGKTLVGGATGKLPDANLAGALRLTNGDTTTGSNGNNQTGAIVSNFTFPTNEGLQVTWTSVTYGGNAYQNNASTNNKSGADGISFFLSDGGTKAAPVAPTVGALGGSLGYSCSNGNGTYDGVIGGYLGIGMDEFGNFSNSGDNTSSGASTGQTPGAIVVRGAGHTAWAWLTANYPTYYPSTLSSSAQATAVQTTCKSGNLYNFSGGNITVSVPTYYTAKYSYIKNGNTVTGTVTSASSIPSSSNCDNSGNPISSGNRACTYTNIATSTSQTVSNGSPIPSNVVGGAYKLDYNYPYLTGSNFPSGTSIFSQEALGTNTSGGSNAIRGNATPITYSLLITQAGLLTFSYSINGGSAFTVINGRDITQSNGPLPASFRFGFSAGTGGGSNVHEITCFKAAPANFSNSTAGTNVQSGRVQTDSQVYLAYYHPINSWGSLTAQSLVFTPATAGTSPTLIVSPTVNWDGGCVLTGGACQSQGTGSAPVTAPLDNTTRTILSWDGSKGIPFEYGNLTSAQQTALTAGDSSQTSDRVDYLRGSRAKEVTASGPFRNRTSLLGDIVDSSPVWVGPPNFPYSAAWSDLLYPKSTAPEGSSYGAWATTNASRINAVYVGANDGMLHGFQAGAYNNGTFDQTTNTGKEVLAYVPSQAAATIHSTTTTLDFASPSYSHNFFVDASPSQGDLYYSGTWHTWLVSGLGPGGQAAGPIADKVTPAVGSVFALDVTDSTKFAESSASSLVMGEWSSASLNASGCTGAGSNCGDHLGATYGTPQIRRMHDGTWGVIFGNGLNSKAGTAGLFIVHINPADGTQKVQFIDTQAVGPQVTVGTSTVNSLNGIAQVTPVDLDGDHVTDYVYAGDVAGNVWRFDLTDASSSNWKVGSAPIFKTQTGQPITSGIAVDAVTTTDQSGASSASPRIILAFGTGQKFPKTLTQDSSYPTTQQSIYGVWDADMAGWNAKSTTQYMSLSSLVTPVAGTSGNLLQQVLTAVAGTTTRTLPTTATVCWQGSTACTSQTNNQMGWEVDLSVTAASGSTPAVAEQVLFNPLIIADVFNTNTSIPQVAQALTCDSSKESAFSFGLSMGTGGAVITATGAASGSNGTYFAGYTANTVAIGTQATGTSSYVTTKDGSQWLVFQKDDGTGGTQRIFPPGKGTGTAGTGARLTWTKMR